MIVETSSITDQDAIVEGLTRAHMTGRWAIGSEFPVPVSPATAMQVQAAVQKRLDKPVLGWKVAVGPGGLPVAAPLLDLAQDGADLALVPDCLIEVELAVRLRRDLPGRPPGEYDRADIVDAIDHVLIGIEIVRCRFDDTKNVPFLSFLADHLGNRAYVVGANLPMSALEEVIGNECLVTLDGQTLFQAPSVHPSGDLLVPLLAYANAQSDGLGGLQAGQIVTTGSLCGVVPINTSGLLQARISQIGTISVSFGS